MDDITPDFGATTLAEIETMTLDEQDAWAADQKRRIQSIRVALLEAKSSREQKAVADWRRRKAEALGITQHLQPESATLSLRGDQ